MGTSAIMILLKAFATEASIPAMSNYKDSGVLLVTSIARSCLRRAKLKASGYCLGSII